MTNKGRKILICGAILVIALAGSGQVRIVGKVLDESGIFPLESVSVMSNSKAGTISDHAGAFEMTVLPDDSIWFSYLGKTTIKFFVGDILYLTDFNVAIKVPATTLPDVRVSGKNYRLDSIRNRIDYQKAFDYLPPSFRSIFTSISITGFVVDIDELLRLFRFREKKRMTTFRNRLIDSEQQKYISRKFNRQVIKEAVDIPEEDLAAFIQLYTPDYPFTITASEYEMKKYIKESYEKYRTK
jgi:hypothetical protein